MPAMTAKLDPF